METVLANLRKARSGEPSALRFGREEGTTSGPQAEAWHVVLSDLAHLSNSTELLVKFARRGFARRLRGRPQLQVEAVTYLDSHLRDDMHHGTLLYEYVKQNFGEPTPVRTRRQTFDFFMPALNVLFYLRPGLSALMHLCYARVHVYFFEALAHCARRQNRPGLASLADLIRKDLERHTLGAATLLDLAGISTWLDRTLARIIVVLWHADVVTSMESYLDPMARRAYRALGFDMAWFRSRVEHVRHGALETAAAPRRKQAGRTAEVERMAV